MFINQHLEDLHFCRGQRLSQRTHSLRVSFARSKRGLQGFIPYFRTKKGRFLLELIGNLANQLAILFVFSLSYVFSLPCKIAICFCQALAGFSSSLGVVNPLRFNGFSSMSDWYSAIFKNFCNRSVINSPCFTQPSITSHLCEIPELCGIDNIHSFNGFNSFYNFLRKTFLHCTYNLVTGKNTKKHATIVYNLSVNRDESYIIPIGITHNCRCTAVQVNPKRYPESNSEEAIQRGRAATFQPNAKGQNKAQIFRFNPGKDKKIFPPKHPYYKAEKEVTDVVTDMEVIFPTEKGLVVYQRQGDQELTNNIQTAEFLANTFGWELYLKKAVNQQSKKTADAINMSLGIELEFKINSEGTLRSIEDSIRRGRKQAHYIVIRFDVEVKKQETINFIKNKIRYLNNNMGNDPRNLEIEEVLVLFDDNDFEKIKRE